MAPANHDLTSYMQIECHPERPIAGNGALAARSPMDGRHLGDQRHFGTGNAPLHPGSGRSRPDPPVGPTCSTGALVHVARRFVARNSLSPRTDVDFGRTADSEALQQCSGRPNGGVQYLQGTEGPRPGVGGLGRSSERGGTEAVRATVVWAILATLVGVAIGATVAGRQYAPDGAPGAGPGRGSGPGWGRGLGGGCGQAGVMGRGGGQGRGYGHGQAAGHGCGRGGGCGQAAATGHGCEHGIGLAHGPCGDCSQAGTVGRGRGRALANGHGRRMGQGRGQCGAVGDSAVEAAGLSCEHCGGHAEPLAEPHSGQATAESTAQFHLAMAELIDAQAEENPDEAKIEQLTERMETLRARLQP